MAGSDRRRQAGAASVEFALAAMTLFMLLFGTIEMARIFFVWNSVQEVTRRAARDASIMPFESGPSIRYDAVLQPSGSNGVFAFPGIGEITNLSVAIEYLGGAMGSLQPVSTLPANASDNRSLCNQGSSACVTAVQAQICQPGSHPCLPVAYLPVGIFGGLLHLAIPISTVTLPLESAGG
jgi:hypothetical protein